MSTKKLTGKKTWPEKALTEIIEIVKGKKLDNITNKPTVNSKRYIQIDDLRNNNNLKYADHNGVEVNKNDVIIAWDGANAGTIGFGLEGYIGSTLARLRLKSENINSDYLGWFLSTKSLYLREKCTGATIPHINKNYLLSIKISIPPISLQKQIVGILEKIDLVKNKRQKANKLTDQFLQSVFIEMFGNPIKNIKRYPLQKLGLLGRLERGRSKHRPRNAPFLLGGKYPLIQTGEIVNSYFLIKEHTQSYSESGLKQSKLWPRNTLCISIAANIAFTAVLNFDSCFPDSVVGFIPSKMVNVEYIHFYFTFIQKKLTELAPQSAQKNINLEILKNLDIMMPPIELQQRFADVVYSIEALKEKQLKSERELNSLFNSLMQKAFNGELTI